MAMKQATDFRKLNIKYKMSPHWTHFLVYSNFKIYLLFKGLDSFYFLFCIRINPPF